MCLTGCGHEVEETLLGEQWVFQTPEVELKNACHRVDVMITLIIHQRILSSFKCILNVIDFDLGAWNSKYTLLLKTIQIDVSNTALNHHWYRLP